MKNRNDMDRKALGAIVFIILTLASCGKKKDNLYPYGWSTIGREFDSLTVLAERRFNGYADADSLRVPVDEMVKLCAAHPENKNMKARAQYWEGRYQYATGEREKGEKLMKTAKALTDSTDDPYTYNRIVWNLDMNYHEPSAGRLDFLKNQYDFFLKSGDLPVTADYAMEIGMLLSDIKDWNRSEYYLHKADSLFSAGGFTSLVSNNRINHANLYLSRGDTVEALKIMKAALKDSVRPIDDRVRDILLGNISEIIGDSASLYEAYNTVRTRYNMEESECRYQIRIAKLKINSGHLDSARYYLNLARANSRYVEEPSIRYEYYDIMARMFSATGLHDSAYLYLRKASELRNNIKKEEVQQEIRNLNVAADIEQIRLNSDISRRRNIIWILSLSLLLLITTTISILIYSCLQRQKLAKVRTKLDLERTGRKLMATEIVLEEKNKILKELESEIHNLKEDGSINDTAARKIDNSIKIHLSGNENSEGFMKTFENLAPQFVIKLKTDYPELTEADLRLASYIAVGLDNKHIARVMSIRPESVKQARWRLRSKLKLTQKDSLEDYLRNFVK